MASKPIWTKDSKLAKVKFEDDKAESADSEVTIPNERYEKPIVVERNVGIINLRCSGKLCVDKDDPLYRGEFVVNPQDESGK